MAAIRAFLDPADTGAPRRRAARSRRPRRDGGLTAGAPDRQRLAARLERLVARATATPTGGSADPAHATATLREVERAGREGARELRALIGELRPVAPAVGTAAAAQAAEREQLARHVHDLVGHGLSLMVLHAAVGALRVERGIEPAREVLLRVDALAADTRRELQQLLAALDGAANPPCGARTVAQLVAAARRHGQLVQADGEHGLLPVDTERIVTAVVREGLTNARKHAGCAAVSVRISNEPASVDVVVANAAGTPLGEPGSGLGLRVLLEQVAALGGHLVSGPAEDGGWRLAAHLPRR